MVTLVVAATAVVVMVKAGETVPRCGPRKTINYQPRESARSEE
jgi:hypothetical protein